jgi:hypothetical protein
MSNSLAIGAVTAAIRNLLNKAGDPLPGEPPTSALTGTTCTARTPDRARGASDTANQLNLFLYQTAPNAALRNMPMPVTGKDGDPAPLALNLYYLVTAYGEGNDEIKTHRLLGRAMSILHARGRLERPDIAAIASTVPGSDLDRYVERIRITPHQLSTEEMSKLWTTFQTQYRLSVAYEVSVVLIENLATAPAGLPVLTRGRSPMPSSPWSGPTAFPSLIPATPTLTELIIEEPTGAVPPAPPFLAEPAARIAPGAQPSSRLTLRGHHLDGTTVVAELKTAARPGVVLTLTPLAGATSEQVQLQLPTDPVNWPAGYYAVNLSITKSPIDRDRRTNALSFALAPRILSLPASVASAGGQITVPVTFTPQARPEQRVSLLVEDREGVAPAHGQTGSLTIAVPGVEPGPQRWVRLRVDGIESLLVLDYNTLPPVFDPSQSIAVT